MARDAAEAETMRDAVVKAGVQELIAEGGRIGRMHGYRGHFLHDHLAERGEPQPWRYDPAKHGDHGADLELLGPFVSHWTM